MSRPTNKSELLAAARKEFAALEKLLAPLTSDQLSAAPAPGEWAIKDILAHLHAWQQMFFSWYESGLRGETPAVPAPGFKWSQLPALNQSIYEQHRRLPLEQVLASLRESHRRTLDLIADLPDQDLTAPGLYGWMNRNTLLAYLHANTDAHYAWAIKDIRKILRRPGA